MPYDHAADLDTALRRDDFCIKLWLNVVGSGRASTSAVSTTDISPRTKNRGGEFLEQAGLVEPVHGQGYEPTTASYDVILAFLERHGHDLAEELGARLDSDDVTLTMQQLVNAIKLARDD